MFTQYGRSVEKRREDACALQSFAKQEGSLGFRTQCFGSAMRLRIAFINALRDKSVATLPGFDFATDNVHLISQA